MSVQCADGAGRFVYFDVPAVGYTFDQKARMDVARDEKLSQQNQHTHNGRYTAAALTGMGDGF